MSEIHWAEGTRLWAVSRDKSDRITELKEVDRDTVREVVHLFDGVRYVLYVEGEQWIWIKSRDLLISGPDGVRIHSGKRVALFSSTAQPDEARIRAIVREEIEKAPNHVSTYITFSGKMRAEDVRRIIREEVESRVREL